MKQTSLGVADALLCNCIGIL